MRGARLTALTARLALVSLLALPTAALAVQPRTSLTAVEADVMCVVCNEPLAVAQAPEADQERSYIQMLINKGYTKAQIERKLVEQYGQAVLARPPARGFSLSLYVLPPALVILGIAILLVTLPRWRARTRARAAPVFDASLALSPDEAERVDAELSHFDG